MDIEDIRKRLNEFVMRQATHGSGAVPEAEALRQEIADAITAHGAQMPELQGLADMLEMLVDPEAHAARMIKTLVPNPVIFDAIDDADAVDVVAALADWDINQMHGDLQQTALYHAMSNMSGLSLPVVTALLERGADPRIGLWPDYNVLHGLGFANCDGLDPQALAEIVTRCVALGADLEQRSTKLQWTPLITAASEWNPVAVEALLLAGADIHARSGNVQDVGFAGETAMGFAEGHGPTTAVLERFLAK